jgi:uncharacterized protein (UPF0248 family)
MKSKIMLPIEMTKEDFNRKLFSRVYNKSDYEISINMRLNNTDYSEKVIKEIRKKSNIDTIENILNYLFGKEDYTIIRCQIVTKDDFRKMFIK